MVVALGFLAVAVAVLALLRFALPAVQPASAEREATRVPAAAASKRQALDAYGRLPLAFVPNAGRLDPRVRYSAQHAGLSVFFTRSEAALTLAKGSRTTAFALRFLGASPAAIEGRRPGAGRVNYVLGNDAREWRTGLHTYGQVVYRNLWPGVDMVFSGAAGRLKYEFVLRPGAKVADIRLAYRGAAAPSLDRAGNLLVPTPLGVLRDERPGSYQEIGGRRVPVASRFSLGGNHANAYGFAVGAYDRGQPLVIDPGLVYSTFLGGSASDQGLGIAVDAAGNAYVTGSTSSTNFPTPVGADTSANGDQDVFVSKLNATGTALVYSTYLGGSSNDQGFAIAVDSLGSAYVTGSTGSTNFPLQSALPPFIYQPFYGGGSTDVFVTKLSPSGTALVFSTYAGGIGADQGFGINVHSSGDVYVTGDTTSSNFPHTPNALQATRSGNSDAFFLRLDRFAAGAGYSSYLGGSVDDSARAIAIDAARNVYLTGGTTSANFPTTAGSFDTSYGGGEDAFVTKLTFVGSGAGGDTYAIGPSTFLGGGGLDRGLGIGLDALGNTYATGITNSSGASPFPATTGALATTFQGGAFDAFATKLNPTASALVYSTYLGGSGNDRGAGIAVDAGGSASLAGRTSSANFPTTPGAFDTTWNLGDDAFVTKFGATGSLLYSTFLGGSSGANGNNDRGQAIALDATGAYVTGLANSGDFPTTVGAYNTTHNGNTDAFVTKLDLIGAPVTSTLEPATDTNVVGEQHCVTATVRDFGGTPVPGVTVRFSVPTHIATFAHPFSGSATTGASGEAQFCFTASLPGTDVIDAFADTNNNGTQDLTAIPPEPSAEATKVWTLPASTTSCDVTNGGWIVADNTDQANFGGKAKVSTDGSTVKGQEEYRDQGPVQPLDLHSISLTAATCSSDLENATIFGTATVDGSGTHVFRIDVTDTSPLGTSDTYAIIVDTGYASGQQQLQGGNVTIHK